MFKKGERAVFHNNNDPNFDYEPDEDCGAFVTIIGYAERKHSDGTSLVLCEFPKGCDDEGLCEVYEKYLRHLTPLEELL